MRFSLSLARLATPAMASLVWVLPAAAQTPGTSAEATITNAGAAAPIAPQDVNECFDRWLATQGGISEGPNLRPNGTLFLARASAEMSSQPGSRQWANDRQAAFTRAELDARAALARYIGEEVNSERSADVFQSSTDPNAPPPRPATEQLSNVERLRTLTGAALDNAIREFNPAWRGGEVTEQERQAQVAREQVTVRQRIASRAALFAAGAMTAQQCEGPNADGRYTVSVTLMWSLRLQEIAESLMDPARARPTTPGQTIAAQFRQRAQEEPNWLAVTTGARVWTNEQGERVVVGFGAVGGTSSASIDEDRARLQALGAIQRFVGERLEVQSSESGEVTTRENGQGERNVFDNQAFQSRIEARARTLRLQGISTLHRWRGKHPWADVPLQVVVLGWTPSTALAAEALRQDLQQGEARARGTTPARNAPGGGQMPSGAPVRAGASVNAADF